MMFEPWIHDTTDPVPADIGGYICPIATVFTGGECGAAESVVSVSTNGTKATNWVGRPAALVLHSEMLVGLARRPVFFPGQDRNGLTKKAISRPLARTQSVG